MSEPIQNPDASASVTSLVSNNSTAPLRTPRKDFSAAFGELQSRYGTVGATVLPDKVSKKKDSGAEASTKSSSKSLRPPTDSDASSSSGKKKKPMLLSLFKKKKDEDSEKKQVEEADAHEG